MKHQLSEKERDRVVGLPTGHRGGMVEDNEQKTFNHFKPYFLFAWSFASML